MQYIDSIIPFTIGALLILFPKLFTKSTGTVFETTKKKFKQMGLLLVGVALIYFIIKIFATKS